MDEFDDSIMMFLREHCEELLEELAYFCDLLEEIPEQKYEYESYLSSADTLNICRDFIKDVIPNYLEKFDDCIANGVVDLKEIENDKNMAYYQIIKEKGRISHEIMVPQKHNIDDVYRFLHEFIHYTNPFDNEFKKSKDSYMLGETISIFFEYILYDYLKSKNNRQDIDNRIYNKIKECKLCCNSLLYNLNFLYEIDSSLDEEYHYVEFEDDFYKSFISKKSDKEDEEYISVDSIIKDFKEDFLYAFGNIIAIMKYYDYKNGRISIKNMIDYNESLRLNNNLESLNHIFIKMPTREDMKKFVDFLKEELNVSKKKGR